MIIIMVIIREESEVMAGTVDLSVVFSVLLVNYKEAGVYFTLAVISGFLISCSCILGKFLNSRLNPDIPSHYLSRAGSLRSHRGHHFADLPQWSVMLAVGPDQQA